jgi:hypothetical protein
MIKYLILVCDLYMMTYMFYTCNNLKTAEQIYVKFYVGEWIYIFPRISVLITVEQ